MANQNQCFLNIYFWGVVSIFWPTVYRTCNPSCSIIQYDTKIINQELDSEPETANYFKLIYYFGNPQYTKVFDEFIIMNALGLLGNVGGTLGMFIGFSFSGVIAMIISFCKQRYLQS